MDIKKALITHVEQILEACRVNEKASLSGIYKSEEIQSYFDFISPEYEFIICVEVNCKYQTEYVISRLSKFIKKEVYTFPVTYHSNIVYWYEGDCLIEQEETDVVKDKKQNKNNIEKTDFLKKSTILPTWLDNFIFNQLNAQYQPDHKRYEYNLDLNNEEVRIYLGTYFPRSYAETFCIFDNLFQNKKYLNKVRKQEINILDTGCGTGGDLMGLLVAIEKYSVATSKIKIFAIDGNAESLSILDRVVKEFTGRIKIKVTLKIIETQIDKINDIDSLNAKFNFIISSKMCCELISKKQDDVYYEICKRCVPLLDDVGLFLLLDVTTKSERHNTFYPVLMNCEINRFIKESDEYKTLIPLACNQYENICNEKCFTQQKILISHKQKNNDISKVTYRIIGHSCLVDEISNKFDNNKYVLFADRHNTKQDNVYCPLSCGDKIIDAYKL